jgi:hypothetical protein
MHALTTTSTAGIGNHLSRAVAGGAFGNLGEASEWGARGPADLACPTAGAAGGGTTAGLGTTSTTGLARLEMGDLDLLLLTEDGLLEADGQVVTQVITLLRATPSRSTGPSGLSATETTEKSFKQISEATDVPHVRCSGSATDTRLPELVVASTGLRIIQNLIGPSDLLEAILRPRIFVDVRVILTRQTAISPFQGVAIGITADPEKLVVISHQLCSGFG